MLRSETFFEELTGTLTRGEKLKPREVRRASLE
jgi:hypothetical protein